MLFFASKGHNSMGGYDVFSSKYDPNTSNWSNPLNLQYPINSPYDDFLYVSDQEGKVAFFTSERNVEAGKLRVMKMLLNVNYITIKTQKYFEMKWDLIIEIVIIN